MGGSVRKLPKITLQDLDWKMVALLAVMLMVTWGDDITGIGELFDPVELVVDAIVAYMLGKRTLERAIERDPGVVVEGKVVDKK